MFRFSIISLLFILITSSQCKESGQESAEVINQQSIFDKISEIDRPKIEFHGNLSHLIEDRLLNSEGKEVYEEAMMKISNGAAQLEMPIRIAKRGVTRKRICEFPPIKLKFYSDSLIADGYSEFNTYKLVTHCMSDNEDLLLREYLAYKLYNHITDNSFRVKLVDIVYHDSNKRIEPIMHHAFIIEEDEELAHRLNTTLIEEDVSSIDRQQYAEMVVFQYMIGNTDWNLTGGHNMKWVQHADIPSPTPIPYDFDFSGLVNAPYAEPHPQLPIENVRQRMLQWRGDSQEELMVYCKEFTADKDNIFAIINGLTDLSEADRADMIQYLETFFVDISDGEI
jgi:hypothetical protein